MAASPPPEPLQFTLPHPSSRQNVIYFHLTPLPNHLQLLLTARPSGSLGSPPAALGSMVYALPNRLKPKEGPLTTPLIVRQDSLELATAIAKALAGRTGRAVTLGCDIGFKDDDVLERIKLVKTIVEGVLNLLDVPEKKDGDAEKNT